LVHQRRIRYDRRNVLSWKPLFETKERLSGLGGKSVADEGLGVMEKIILYRLRRRENREEGSVPVWEMNKGGVGD